MIPIDPRKVFDLYGQSLDSINSPFAFPRLPPRANPPLGMSGSSRIKDDIIQDSELLIGRLNGYHTTFQRYASGLFNFAPNRLSPGHPIHLKTRTVEEIEEENQKLKNEIARMADRNREKKT